jgi:hypothetical protein
MRKTTSGGARPFRYLLVLLLISGAGCAKHASPAMTAGSAPQNKADYGYEAEASQPMAASAEEGLSDGDAAPMEAPAAPPPPPMAPGSPGGAAPPVATPAPEPTPPPVETRTEPRDQTKAPLLIYSATLTMAVFGTDQALEAVEKLAKDKRGYLVRRSDQSITIRVPASVFEETLNGVGKLGDELHRDVSARDVTEEYSDLEIRLRNAEVVRARLEALLARSNNVEEALAVERELERVTRTIEQIKGRLKLLGELVAFSTITVNFRPHAVDRVNPDVPLPFDWLRQLGLPTLLSL